MHDGIIYYLNHIKAGDQVESSDILKQNGETKYLLNTYTGRLVCQPGY